VRVITYGYARAALTAYSSFSGIAAEALEPVTTTLADVQAHLSTLISHSTILLGYSLESDLHALRYSHRQCIDTALIFHHPRGHPLKPGLAWLTRKADPTVLNSDRSRRLREAYSLSQPSFYGCNHHWHARFFFSSIFFLFVLFVAISFISSLCSIFVNRSATFTRPFSSTVFSMRIEKHRNWQDAVRCNVERYRERQHE
jgi:hypothetical protein